MNSNGTSHTGWGFPPATLAFLKDLEAHNDREWFNANKERYEHVLKRPAQEFCERMGPKLDALCGRSHSSKVFRVHRDLRFSKDKTPFNVNVRVAFTAGDTAPTWFFSLEPNALTIGVGVFTFDKAQLERYRDCVATNDGVLLERLAKAIRAQHGRFNEPELKRVPKPYSPTDTRSEWLRRKGLTAWKDYADPSLATDTDWENTCADGYASLRPIYDWLVNNVLTVGVGQD